MPNETDTSQLAMDADSIRKAIRRIAHEIIERNADLPRLIVRGSRHAAWKSPAASSTTSRKSRGERPEFGIVDVSMHRDDLSTRGKVTGCRALAAPSRSRRQAARARGRRALHPAAASRGDGRHLVSSAGRPASSTRRWWIAGIANCRSAPDYVGKNLPTAREDRIRVRFENLDGEPDSVKIVKGPGEMKTWTRKDLTGLDELDAGELMVLLDTAKAFKRVNERRPEKKCRPLRGKTLVNFFVEPSTRTRISFELAALRLSADVVNIAAGASSLQKGETLKDTAMNLQGAAYGHSSCCGTAPRERRTSSQSGSRRA